MIVWLLMVALGWSDAPALQRTAPRELADVSIAAEHLGAARWAGAAYGIDADLLLAIAYRESRYQVDAVTREVSGKLSCGLMMVTMPKGIPCPSWSVLEGYMAGAEHLSQWFRATRDSRSALLGYAGGYRMIERCKLGPLLRVRGGVEVDLCGTPELQRAAWIRRVRERASSRSS